MSAVICCRYDGLKMFRQSRDASKKETHEKQEGKTRVTCAGRRRQWSGRPTNPKNEPRTSNARTPHHLLDGTITPNGLHFVEARTGFPDIEVVKKIAGRAHIAVSAPGGTSASSMASGIGPIGPIGGVGPVPSGLSVL
jgi:hypothetical protein